MVTRATGAWCGRVSVRWHSPPSWRRWSCICRPRRARARPSRRSRRSSATRRASCAASIIAFLCGTFVNSYVLAKMKIWTRGRWLWTRIVGSTLCGELVDSVIFYFVAFYGRMPGAHLVAIMFTQYVLKSGWEIVAAPLTYRVVAFLKRAEQEDYYDIGTELHALLAEDLSAGRSIGRRFATICHSASKAPPESRREIAPHGRRSPPDMAMPAHEELSMKTAIVEGGLDDRVDGAQRGGSGGCARDEAPAAGAGGIRHRGGHRRLRRRADRRGGGRRGSAPGSAIGCIARGGPQGRSAGRRSSRATSRSSRP